ncbi:MAG: ABC transporter ATP-binding protein [Candidatus Babeliales bacterium]
MNSIRLVNVTKSFNNDLILENLTLEIPLGQFFALLGPSGCGKTTILRLIAGFEQPDEGHIFIGDKDVTHVPANQRSVNTVFQQYALFPHMTVFENVAYSLTIRRVDKETIKQKVMRVLKTVHLDAHVSKSIQQLSGGQQQRVALARAIINEPKVLLLDEPLAALDVKLREKMLVELIELQDHLKTTFVYVTHDQLEALTVADQMAIMTPDGVIDQVGKPKMVYEFPASVFVARFVGTTNIFDGTFKKEHDKTVVEVAGLPLLEVSVSDKQVAPGQRVHMSIRPEKIVIDKKQREGFANVLKGMVTSIVFHGYATLYHVTLDNDIKVHVFRQNKDHVAEETINYDDVVFVHWHKDTAVVLEL